MTMMMGTMPQTMMKIAWIRVQSSKLMERGEHATTSILRNMKRNATRKSFRLSVLLFAANAVDPMLALIREESLRSKASRKGAKL